MSVVNIIWLLRRMAAVCDAYKTLICASLHFVEGCWGLMEEEVSFSSFEDIADLL